MNISLQWLSYQVHRVAWQGQLALLFFIASLFILLMIKNSIEEEKQLALVVEQLKQNKPIVHNREKSANEMSHDFYAALPSQEQSNQKIAQLLDLVEQHGLTLNRADFSTKAIPKSKMVLYRITFPIEGSYLKIRRFVTDVMNRQPSLALSQINFKRDNVDSDRVSSDIEFFLYTKKAGRN